jgi:hypothetical protein
VNNRDLRKRRKGKMDMQHDADKPGDDDTNVTRTVEVPEEELPDEDKDFFSKSLAKFRGVPFTPEIRKTGKEK